MFKNRGFTLMEMMIVIAILGIIIPFLTPVLSTYLARARDATRIADLRTIKNALMVYEQDTGAYPIGFALPNVTHDFFTFNNLFSIDSVHAFGGGGGGFGCPMIGILCAPGYEPYQDPISCVDSCIPGIWTRTDDQCASYLNDPRFVQIIGKIPKDPRHKKPFPCLDTGDIGSYGYATGTGADGNIHFIITAELESSPMANVGYNAIQAALVAQDLDLLKDKPKGSYVDTPGDVPYFVEYE